MPKISAVIITFNEERDIARCIESVRDVVDEIVIVDSFSDDRTEKICESYSVKFIKHKFEGYIEQKNWALKQASNPHILSLDADEALSEELKQSIINVKKNWTHDGYYFNRLTNYCGKWLRYSWYPDRKLRLWDSRKGSWQGINPHDEFVLQDGVKTNFLKGDLLHYSYYTISEHVNQANRFTDISVKAAFAKGKKATLFKILFSPVFKFLRDYIFKLGFLDGYYGFLVCQISANATFLKYIKLRQLHQQESKHMK